MQTITDYSKSILTEKTVNEIESEAQVLEFIAYQIGGNDTHLKLTFDIQGSFELSKNKIAGTILNELFRWVSFQREIGAKALQLNLPILLRFNVGGMSIDTGHVKKEVQQVLKLQNTAAGRKRYALRFMNTINYAAAKVQMKDYAVLLQELSDAILAENN